MVMGVWGWKAAPKGNEDGLGGTLPSFAACHCLVALTAQINVGILAMESGGSASDPALFVHWEVLWFSDLIRPQISPVWFFPVMPMFIQPWGIFLFYSLMFFLCEFLSLFYWNFVGECWEGTGCDLLGSLKITGSVWNFCCCISFPITLGGFLIVRNIEKFWDYTGFSHQFATILHQRTKEPEVKIPLVHHHVSLLSVSRTFSLPCWRVDL